LERLRDLSQNFPAHIQSLLRVKFPTDFKTKIQQLQQQNHGLFETRNPSNPQEMIRKNALYVNGIEADLTKLSAFSLYDLVIKESQFIKRFEKWNIHPEVLDKLLYISKSSNSDQEHPRFLIPQDLKDHIVWLNDVDNDDRYAYNFPRELHTMLQQTFFGQMRFVRRNIINGILLFDPLNNDHLSKIQELMQMVHRGYPIRVGLLPRVYDERSVEFAARFEHLNLIRGAQSAMQYMFELQHADKNLDTIKNQYNHYRGRNTAVDVAKPEHDRMQNRKKLINDGMGLESPNFALLINGALFDGSSESGDQLLMNGLRFEYEKVVQLIREEKLSDDMTDLQDEIIKASKHYSRYNALIFGDGKYEIAEAPKSEYIGGKGLKKYTQVICSTDSDTIESAKEFVKKYEDTRITVLNPSDNYCKKYFANSGIIAATGRIIELDRKFSQEDWELLREFEKSIVGDLLNPNDLGAHPNEWKSDAIFNLNSIISAFQKNVGSRSRVDIDNQVTKLTFNSESTLPSVLAIINPLSLDAQRLTPILTWLVKYKYPVTIHLNPLLETSNVPLKTYYRYVLHDSDMAQFDSIRTSNGEIYTLRMDVPESWLIESIYAEQDLDNLNLYSDCSSETCHARFQLEHLVITGTCFDKTHRRAPRGLELELIDSNSTIHDVTLVMANLGYFQLKSQPGIYNVELPKGRHSEIYEIESVNQVPFYEQSMQLRASAPTAHSIIVNDFDAPFATINVKRNSDEELLIDEQESKSIWNLFGKKDVSICITN
jgi:hypothetical protein